MASGPKKGAAAQAAADAKNEPDLPNEFLDASEVVEAIVEPALEMQETVRDVTEKGIVESRAAFVKAKVSAKDVSNAFELSFAAAKDGVLAVNAKAFAAVRANTEANLDFIKSSLTAKSVSDFVALQSEFACKQTDAVVVQFQELGELAKNAVVETFQPIKDQVTKSLKIAV